MKVGEPRALVVGKWLFAAIVPLSALALGSLLTPVLVAMTLAAALSCVLLWIHPRSDVPPRVRWLLAAIGLLLAYTIVQALPLPAGVVRALAPANAEIWARVLEPFREPAPAWQSISVAPVATRVEALRGAFYACLTLSAVRVAALEDGTRFLERLVVASASAMAIATLAHAAFRAESVFGVYRPREIYAYEVGRYGPLLNVNHVAAYLDAGACVAIGVALSRRPAIPRALAVAAVVLTASTSVWVGSRGGTGALVFGVVVTIALVAYSRRRFASSAVAASAVTGAIAVAAILVGFASSESARTDLAAHDTSKLEIARDALALVPRSPFFGFGRGAFESVFPSVRHAPTYVTFTHPENLVAQWAVEWGLPIAVAAAALLAVALRPAAVLAAARPAVGAWTAIAACVVHEFVDYHLEVPGVVALVAVLAVLVVASRGHVRPDESSRDVRAGSPLRRVAFAAAAVAGIAAAWTMPDAAHTLMADRAELGVMAADRAVSSESFRGALRAAMLRYPAEPFFPLMGGVRASVMRDESALPWLGAALERDARFGRAHLVLARTLRASHTAQARLEYRLAFEYDERLRAPVLAEVPPLVHDVDDALELVPKGEGGVAMLDSLAASLAPRLPSTSARLDEELLQRAPSHRGALTRRAAAMLLDLRDDAPWCADRKVCERDAVAAAERIATTFRDDCDAQVLLANVQIAAGDPTGALDRLEASVDATSERPKCLREVVRLANDTHQRARADAALEHLVRGGCGAAAECAELYRWAAAIEDGRGNLARAIGLYQRAYEAAPDHDDVLERLATLYDRAGMLAQALDAYTRLAQRHPDDPRWTQKESETREKVRSRASSIALPLPTP